MLGERREKQDEQGEQKKHDDQITAMMREVANEAAVLLGQMKRQVDSVTSKVVKYNAAYEWEDYHQEAYLAVYDAVLRFSPLHAVTDRESQRTSQMQKQTFAQWFVQKRLFKMADLKEICFNVYDGNTCIEILTNSEYRKRKKELESKGYTIRSTRNTYHFSELASNKEGKIIEFDPAMPEPESEDEVQEWIKKNF